LILFTGQTSVLIFLGAVSVFGAHLKFHSPPVRFGVLLLLRAEAIGRVHAFCPKSQCRSLVFLPPVDL
jgi:hypothetical protein